MDQKRFSLEEAAPLIGISRARIYQLVKAREIRVRRIGKRGRMFLLQSDIDKIIGEDSLILAGEEVSSAGPE